LEIDAMASDHSKLALDFWLLTALTMAINAMAETPATPPAEGQRHHEHQRYRLVDLGTFGGPNSQFSTPSARAINVRGSAAGVADTAAPDPTCFFDCSIDHAFVWKNGVTTDLGTLPGGLSSFAYVINDHGLIAGQSQIGTMDPLTGLPELRAVLWGNGKTMELGTLGGNASNPFSINNRGEVVGAATNGTPDPFANAVMSACHILETGSCAGYTFSFGALFTSTGTETHAVLWRESSIYDLGTLGGPDSVAEINNDRGDVAGWSYLSFTANAATGTPTVDPFFWNRENHVMIDMGSLGGTFGAPFWMNNVGQVVGVSNLPGDKAVHPFIWSLRKGMEDLGTLGGTYAHPDWINDAGDVVGTSTTPTGHLRAFYWHDGKMTNLGTVGADPDSEALSINSSGQVVGGSYVRGGADLHGFLWENGGPLVDLNALLIPGSKVRVIFATQINDRGEIAGTGMLPSGDTHAILLFPCHGEDQEECD
jgi:probable HAF family extracellular repeat protein